MKTKIVNILHHTYAYEYIKDDTRPQINWDTPDGSWVGIWRGNWQDILGNEVLKLTDRFLYEVWLPDLRTDKIYHHQFKNGLVIKIFPAQISIREHLFIRDPSIVSDRMIEQINSESTRFNVVLHLNCDPLTPIAYHIISQCRHLPVIISFLSVFKAPQELVWRPRVNILRTLEHIGKIVRLRKILPYIDFCTFQNRQQERYLRKVQYHGPTARLTMGCDFDFWIPGDKIKARERLGISPKTFVISMASRFNNLKQIDKVIQVLTKIDLNGEYDFLLMVSGHGEKMHEEYLHNISSELISKKKIRFTGFVDENEMRSVYQASDLFISASTSEGCSVSVIKALACKVPVFSTKVGGTYDIMKPMNAGRFVEIYNYRQWESELTRLLNGDTIDTFDREYAKKHFHWPNIAQAFVEIYELLSEGYLKRGNIRGKSKANILNINPEEEYNEEK